MGGVEVHLVEHALITSQANDRPEALHRSCRPRSCPTENASSANSSTLESRPEIGPAWTRTRGLFLIREAQRFAARFQSLQKSCKFGISLREAFPNVSGYLPRLLHTECTLKTRTCDLF